MEKEKIKTNFDYCTQSIEHMLEIYDISKIKGATKDKVRKWLQAKCEE